MSNNPKSIDTKATSKSLLNFILLCIVILSRSYSYASRIVAIILSRPC